MMKINPNKEERTKIALAVRDNGGYCPCLLEKNEDTMCPCKAKREEEYCCCGLYVKAD